MENRLQNSRHSQVPEAFAYAYKLHADQKRKGSDTPYIAHLMSVAARVYEMGGSETEIIAALLHDSVEDQGGRTVLDEIHDRFGDEVAQIVLNCSDSMGKPKPPWRERKVAFLARIKTFDESTLRVVLADKTHNVSSTLLDLKTNAQSTVWKKFNGGKSGSIWYYTQLKLELSKRIDSIYMDEFCAIVDEIVRIGN
ncbi:MAG: HD domain-containing protein [Aliifodinibius sp.]|nr:HD domain-containing protein [candidate division Zixibacteria bacterium]NIT58152.1 HD domain-containing protein [Fodinibius sp.]NIR64848.1 HD domain-containing protein [candidate division Zixibacteria bacterium]NIS46666.1 HD domain-containing protein [candidate division Zixibacteria bacterium]NIU14791.1 HD domain-containing protein [candidate division Zixibacteria bacterium]